MKTVTILEYDHNVHQFYPSFVIRNNGCYLEDDECCAFDELVIQPSQEWMMEYLEWNRFASRLPDNPAEDLCEEDDPSCLLPQFDSLDDLHRFNAQGYDLTRRLQEELDGNGYKIRVEPYRPLYSNLMVGSISSWWHLKDRNYGFVIPSVQRLPVSDNVKSRLQAFRCHKGMEFWNCLQQNGGNDDDDPNTIIQQLQQEGYDLQVDLTKELDPTHPQQTTATATTTTGSSGKETTQKEKRLHHQQQEGCPTLLAPSITMPPRVDSIASIGAMLEQSCKLVAAAAVSTTTNTTAAAAQTAAAATVVLEGATVPAASTRAKSASSWSPTKVVQPRAQ